MAFSRAEVVGQKFADFALSAVGPEYFKPYAEQLADRSALRSMVPWITPISPT